jgi:hypothetical protein
MFPGFLTTAQAQANLLGRVFKPGDPPKSPFLRGTLTGFFPLFKAGALVRSWGGSSLEQTGKYRV